MVEFQHLDKRVQRTKLNLYNAFIELLKQKKYEQITIKDIIDYAGYSRGTFYIHYKQKDDLLNEIINSLFKEVRKAQRTSYINEDSIDVRRLEDEPIYILRHFKEYRKYYETLLGENIQIDFSRKLTNFFIDLYMKDFEMQNTADQNAINENLLNRYHAHGLIGLILDWIIADFPTEPEEFSKELVKTFKYSLGTIQIKK